VILVLGGEGQLGRALASVRRPDVVAVGRGVVDVNRPGTLATAIGRWRPQVVINAAAWTDVDGAEADRGGAYTVNAWGAGRVADLCGAHDIALVHVSTDHVFDGRGGAPYGPGDRMAPANAYGASKAEGERRVRASGARAAIVRTAWLNGQDTGFAGVIRRAHALGRPLSGAVDEIGQPTHVGSLARWILALCDDAPSGPWRVWHAVGPTPMRRLDWVRALAPGAVVRPVLSRSFGRAAVRPRDARLDGTAARAAYGWRVGEGA